MNTTAYHPQTDGLVERLNRTLLDMLAKTVEKNGKNWDRELPYVLFAYRASLQESTRESPFFLMYGRDPRLPSEETLSGRVRETLDVEDYRSELASGMAEAWELARANVQKAQKRQKRYHDRRATDSLFRVGERVFIYMPAEKQWKAYKFAKPYRGPFRVIALHDGGLEVKPVDKPQAQGMRVALNRVRRCPAEIGGTDDQEKSVEPLPTPDVGPPPPPAVEPLPPPLPVVGPLQQPVAKPLGKTSTDGSEDQPPPTSTWGGRLRPRKNPGEDAG